ncbi:MAG: sensor domain-containing diguanylate cyclase [Gammaproteobacteria bacterium]|nr:MAG: sensor domain-containing diguanylate cyclase [Gammaproteobacteria bacterium]
MTLVEEHNTISKLDTLVRAEKLELLFQQSYPAIFVSIITAIVLSAILWPVQSHSVLLIWFTILAATSVGRYILFTRYRRASPQQEDVLAWEKPYFATLTLSSLAWGVGSVFIMPADSPVHQAAILYFMIGMAGGAISVYSAHRFMTLATVAIVLLPATAWFLLQGNLLSIGMVIGAIIFFLSAIRATKVLSLKLHQSFSLTHALRESEEKYRLAMESTRDGLWDWNVTTGKVHYSPGWSRILGEETAQQSYSTWEDRVHPVDKPRILKTLHKHMAGEKSTWREEHRLRHADGSWVWVIGRGQVVERDQQGTPLRMIGTMTDITDQKQAELDLQESKEKYQRLVEDIGDRFAFYSLKALTGELLYVSGGFDSVFGFPKEKALGQPWQTIINWQAGVEDKTHRYLSQLIEKEIDFAQFDMEFIPPDGSERTIRISAHPVKDKSGEVVIVEGFAENVTEEKLAQEQLRLAANVFAVSQNGVIITNTDNRILDVNPACLRMTGYSRQELLGENPSIFSSGKHTPEFYREMWQTLKEEGHWEGEVWNRKKTGEIYSEQLKINAVNDENGKLQHYVAIFHDISYLKEREAELKHIAFSDILTGLPNRLLLYDRMQQAILKTNRSEERIAICYLDLDDFKPINDTYGHYAGDQVLIEVANRLKDAIRSNDTAARIGGDEFVLLLQDITDTGELEELLQRILKVVSEPYKMPFATITISASIGIALQQREDCEADLLLQYADQAMYDAKGRGKNQYSFFTPGVK